MATITLYHGSPDKIVNPTFGLGQDKHDYGRGFYLTQDLQLAKEWSVSRPGEVCGYVHTFSLETDGLIITDFEECGCLSWIAELMKHRDAVDSKRYRMLAAKFIEKYAVDTQKSDVIRGRQWCIKSEKAYSQLCKVGTVMPVNFKEFNAMYNDRDSTSRLKMKELINSDKNKVEKVFSTLI